MVKSGAAAGFEALRTVVGRVSPIGNRRCYPNQRHTAGDDTSCKPLLHIYSLLGRSFLHYAIPPVQDVALTLGVDIASASQRGMRDPMTA